MSASAAWGLGVPTRTLVLVFGAMAALFTLVTFLSRWYEAERLSRARDFFERGQALAAKGRDAEAVLAYRNALAISHGTGPYRLELARTLVRLGRLAEGSVYLQELLRADPGDAEPNLLLARIAARENRPQTAITYYNRAIFGYWPAQAEENRLEVRWELIGLLEKLEPRQDRGSPQDRGARNQILAELLQIADQAPNDPELKKRVAARLLANGSPTQAAELYREVLRERPRDGGALAGYGEAQFALGHYLTAQAYLRRAAPADEAARAKLGQADQVLALNPMLPGLGLAERYARSRTLLERAATALDTCLAAQKTPPAQAAELAVRAHNQLAGRRRRPLAEAIEENVALADDLWAARAAACGPADGADPALARVMTTLSR